MTIGKEFKVFVFQPWLKKWDPGKVEIKVGMGAQASPAGDTAWTEEAWCEMSVGSEVRAAERQSSLAWTVPLRQAIALLSPLVHKETVILE